MLDELCRRDVVAGDPGVKDGWVKTDGSAARVGSCRIVWLYVGKF